MLNICFVHITTLKLFRIQIKTKYSDGNILNFQGVYET